MPCVYFCLCLPQTAQMTQISFFHEIGEIRVLYPSTAPDIRVISVVRVHSVIHSKDITPSFTAKFIPTFTTSFVFMAKALS